jgi:hypothetical protein
MSIKRLIPFLALLATAGAAHATPVDDFKSGTAVLVESATVDVGNGPRTTSGSGLISKQGGTFVFALRAADLGIELPITINLRGSVTAGGWIQLDVDNAYAPPIDVGGGHRLSRVTGRLTMRALPRAGSERHDVGNVRLQLAAASSFVAHGDWGSVTIAVNKLQLLGGVPQPPLTSFVNPSTALICSSRAPTYHTLAVWLTDQATASGTSVGLDSPQGAGVRVPTAIVVRPGNRTANVRARIEPNFVGRVRLTASAGGIERALDITVNPSGDCERR